MHANGNAGINYFLNKLNAFFSTHFLKKYFVFIGFPVLFGGLYLLDTMVLPGTEIQDQPYSYYIYYPRKGSSRKHFAYTTTKDYQFKTTGWRVRNGQITLEISPIFHFVISVQDGEKKIELASGINGVFGLALKVWAIATLISILYVLIVGNPTENARLNLVFFQLIWLFITLYAYQMYG